MLDELNRIISMYRPPSPWAAKQWVIGSQQSKIDAYERDFWDFVKANIPGFDYTFAIEDSFSTFGAFLKDGGSTSDGWQDKGWDFVSSGTAITEERQEFAVFSLPYGGTTQSLMCRDDLGFNSINDVDKATVKVSAIVNSIHEAKAEELGFEIVVGVNTIEEAYEKIITKEVDCLIAQENQVTANMSRLSTTKQIKDVQYGVWELIDVDAGLPRVLQGDMLNELNRIIYMYKPPSLPSTWAAKQWVIGSMRTTIDAYERDFWDFVKANIPGFHYRFAIEDSYYTFDAFLRDGGSTTADWQEKGWDFVSAGTAITEERQEFAVFSSSYAGTAQSLMCRDDSGFNSIDDVDKTTVKVSAKKRWIRQGRAEEFGFKNVVGVYTIEESYQKMMNGEVDCFIAYENLLMPNMTRAVITAQLYSVDYGVWELVDVDAGLPRVLQGVMLDELNHVIDMYISGSGSGDSDDSGDGIISPGFIIQPSTVQYGIFIL